MELANIELYIFIKFKYISSISCMKDSVSFFSYQNKDCYLK